MSSSLVILDSDNRTNELAAVVRNKNKTGEWFIGLKVTGQNDNQWKWSNGEVAERNSTSWAIGQPSYRPEGNCVVIRRDNETESCRWYNVYCESNRFICEKAPHIPFSEPSTSTGTDETEPGSSEPVTGDEASSPSEYSPHTESSPSEYSPHTEGSPSEYSSHIESSPSEYSPHTESSPSEYSPHTESSPSEYSPHTESSPSEYSSHSESFPSEYSPRECSLNFVLNDVKHQPNRGTIGGHEMLDVTVSHGADISLICGDGFRHNFDRISCNDGQLFPSQSSYKCEDINECETETSRHLCDLRNAQCLNTVGSFKCVCDSGFVEETQSGFCVPESRSGSGVSVQLHKDKTLFCESEKDEDFDIEWSRTPSAQSTEWIPCPHALGFMIRYCDEHGNWAAPDTTLCKSGAMAELEKNLHVKQNGTLNSTFMLDLLLDVFDGEEAMYGGDIIVAKDILAAVAASSQYDDESKTEKDLLQVIKQFLEASDRSLDRGLEEQWKNIYETYGPSGCAVSILSSMEDFGSTVFAYMVKTGKNLFLQSKNIDLVGHFVGRGRDDAKRRRRTLVSNNTVSKLDTVTLSSEFLSQFDGNKTDLPVALVIFVYRAAGDILPADFRQTTATRTWVKTITATKIINKVNTVALAVSVHPKLEGVLYKMDDLAKLRLYKMQEAYNPRCSFADLGSRFGLWDTSMCRLLRQGIDELGEYVECACNQPGTFCSVMSLGEQPLPFLESAEKVVMMIYSSLSALLILFALIMVAFARLSSDRYFVLGQAMLTHASFPILLCAASALQHTSREQEGCQILSVEMTYGLLSNCCWMVNLSVQQCLRLIYIDCRNLTRILYLLFGWVLPLIFVVSMYGNQLPEYKHIASCWLIYTTFALVICIATQVVLLTVSLALLCYGYHIYSINMRNYDADEKERLWEDIFSLILLYGTFVTVRVIGYSATLTDSLLGSYFLTMAVFSEGSVIFLSFFATNREVLVAIRIRICGDEDERYRLTTVQANESETLADRRFILERTNDRVQETRRRRKKEEDKSRKIISLFDAARGLNRIDVK
ncbi:adhesion G protein-coupled receptor L4-like [Ptychodera flava]|uniref:adhesion G protein-coupled receptor L4-like n=1 Tax=Ptychodera flava TaxID=63121 RepID=UPI003969DB5A